MCGLVGWCLLYLIKCSAFLMSLGVFTITKLLLERNTKPVPGKTKQ